MFKAEFYHKNGGIARTRLRQDLDLLRAVAQQNEIYIYPIYSINNLHSANQNKQKITWVEYENCLIYRALLQIERMHDYFILFYALFSAFILFTLVSLLCFFFLFILPPTVNILYIQLYTIVPANIHSFRGRRKSKSCSSTACCAIAFSSVALQFSFNLVTSIRRIIGASLVTMLHTLMFIFALDLICPIEWMGWSCIMIALKVLGMAIE